MLIVHSIAEVLCSEPVCIIWLMPTHADLENLARELKARRLALGEPVLARFAKKIGVSRQHLSHLESAYVHPSRGPVLPSDEMLEKISKGYGVPLSRLHALLGRMPDAPIPVFKSPQALLIAERFDRLPEGFQGVALAFFDAIEALAKGH